MTDVPEAPGASTPGPAQRDDRVRWPRAVRGPLIAAAIVVIAAGLRAGAGIFAPMVLAAFIAVVSLPLLRWLMRRGVPVPIAIPVVVLLDAAVLAIVGLILIQSVAELRAVAPAYLARIQELELEAILRLQGWGYEVTVLPYREIVNPERLFALATGAALRLTEIAGITLLVVLYLVFMLAESVGLPTKLRRAFGTRFGTGEHLASVVGEVQRYLALKTLVSLATGVLIGTAAAVIGVDFALFWGFLAFVLNYVPSVGSFLAAVPALAVSMLQLGAGPTIMLAGVYLAVNISIGSVLDPIIIGRRLGLSTLVVLISLVFWGWTWGVIGMFLALPLTAAAKIAMENSETMRPVAVLLGPVPAKLGMRNSGAISGEEAVAGVER